jgi:glycosyltransferase involved in cell wall biosynthesis
MSMANWLHDTADTALQIEKPQKTLKDLWVDTFISYSHACYEACSEIITLYAGNQQFQLQDGAPPRKLRVIPNGIDYDRYVAIQRSRAPRPPTIALIGRVVPIKDVKTFIRACSILKGVLRELEALVLGPSEEDETYYLECRNMVQHLFLQDTVNFAGRVKLDEYLGRIDVVVLTSISEAQPLVVLEAGAVGIPSVTTDVGSCRELLLGRPNEDPPLGPGGDVTPLCNPSATAHSLTRLLTDSDWYDRCSRAIKERVRLYYNKKVVDRTYSQLYARYLEGEALRISNCEFRI